MNARYIVTIESDNLYAEVWCNHVPVGTISPSEGSPFSFPINEFLLEGENNIGIMVHAGPNPSTAGKPWGSDPKAHAYHGPAKLSLKFARYGPEETPFRETPPVLVAIDWQGEAVPVPFYQEKAVTLPRFAEPPLWTNAETFAALDAPVHREAIDYLSYLYDLLTQHRFETYLELSKPRLEVMTKSYGLPVEPLLQQMAAVLHTATVDPVYRLDPFSPETIDLRLVANGRLIDVNRVGRGAIFEYTFKKGGSPKQTYFLPVKIGKKSGKWLLLA